MENNEKAIEALKKIEEIINGVSDMFPNIKSKQAEFPAKKYNDPVKVLKRIDGIIKYYDENNAERKLESLLKFLRNRLIK